MKQTKTLSLKPTERLIHVADLVKQNFFRNENTALFSTQLHILRTDYDVPVSYTHLTLPTRRTV